MNKAPARTASAVDWEQVLHLLLVRSGGRCEVRAPGCLGRGPQRLVVTLPRQRVSIHHRRTRGIGGSRAEDTHLLSNLMVVCGHGTLGCHELINAAGMRPIAERLGYVVRHGITPPAEVPVTLPGGRLVLLVNDPVYVDVHGAPSYDLTAPSWVA